MKTAAVTLWFALATLLGPAACCCSFAHAAPAKTPTPESPEAPRPVKSCCGKHHAAEPAARPVSHHDHGQPAKPAKCPCDASKRALTSLPPKPANEQPAGHAPALPVGPTADPFAASLLAVRTVRVAIPPSAYHLAGRDLLAAYSVLTC